MRLTQTIRAKILANIVADHALAQRARDVMTESQDIAITALTAAFPDGVKTMVGFHVWLAEFRKRFKNNNMVGATVYVDWVTYIQDGNEITGIRDSQFSINVGGFNRTVSLSGDRNRSDDLSPNIGHIVPGFDVELLKRIILKDDTGTLMPYYIPRNLVSFDADSALAKRIDKNDAERRAIRDEYAVLSRTVKAALAKHTTSEKLIAAWPEVAPFIPKDAKPTGTAVALDKETLNAICGLPK